MRIQRIRRVYNVLFMITMAFLLSLLVLFTLFLISASSADVDLSVLEAFFVPILLLTGMILLLVIFMFSLVVRIAVIFDSFINNELDADAASAMLSECSKIYGRRKSSVSYNLFNSQIHDLRGEYGEALHQFLKWEARHRSSRNQVRRAYFYLRSSQLENAVSILKPLEGKTNMVPRFDSAQLHTCGLYYLETGDMDQARQYLTVSSFLEKGNPITPSRISRLNCAFDFARLEEKEGNPDKAIEHYKQAAAIGPKTWLGQEAARCAEALEGL